MPIQLRLILYPIFGLFCLALFSFLLFPFDSLRNRIQGEMERRVGNYTVTVGRVSPALFTGITLKAVKMEPKAKGVPVSLDKVRVKIRLLPLLWGGRQFGLFIKSGKGSLEGTISLKGDETQMDLELEKFDLAAGRLIVPFPLSGQIDGEVRLTLNASDPLRNTGKLKLGIGDLQTEAVGDESEFPVPAMVLARPGKEKSLLEIEVVRGNWEVRSLQLVGGDLQLKAGGKVYGARRINNYRLNLKGDFVVLPEMASKLVFLPLIENQKVEGKYPFSITGRLSKPSIRIGEFRVPI